MTFLIAIHATHASHDPRVRESRVRVMLLLDVMRACA